MTTRQDALALDAADPLAPLRDQFELPAGVIYLDGNSLGALPQRTAARIQQVITGEWGQGLIRSWNSAGWVSLAQRLGDQLAPWVGAAPGELLVGDSTSVNVFKALNAALAISRHLATSGPSNGPSHALPRVRIVSERSNFPTDLYIAETLAATHGLQLTLVDDPAGIPAQLDHTVAVLMLTHVHYRTGRMHDMAALTRAAHDAGALVLWDLAHSAGAVPVDLNGAGADFAVGCGYKYLNGGPGAPAFLWAHARHTRLMEAAGLNQPLSGWFSHAAPFDFTPGYTAASGIQRFACGTPPVLSMAALACGLDTLDASRPLGGMAALRAKSLALGRLFIEQVEAQCAGHGLSLATPREDAHRGSQVSLAHPGIGYPVMQALIARGVIGDFRAPDILRFGFTPLYTRFVDVWDAADHLAQVLRSGEWQQPQFQTRSAVT